MKRSYFRCPNRLIRDARLSFTTRRVGCILFAYSNALGTCRKSYQDIARLAAVSVPTVVEAVRTLAQYGYLSFETTRRYYSALQGVGYGKTIYSLNPAVLREGYTLMDRRSFRYDLPASAFVLYAVVLMFLGVRKRAWPSISQLQKAAGAARSTVCAGLKLLKRLPTLFVQLCMKRNGAFAASSYRPANVCRPSASPAAETAASAGAQAHPSSSFYCTIKTRLLQGLKRIFSWWGVVRNFANYDIT